MTLATARQRPSAKSEMRLRFSALAAILALFGMLILSTWHDALPHVHAQSSVASIADVDHDHGHPPGHKPDSADLMHFAAHAALQTIDLSKPPAFDLPALPIVAIWMATPSTAFRSIAPLSILRPPRN